jgi:tryptophanyl-tRNA synthetase
LADHLIEYFRPYRERRSELAAEPGLVDRVLAEGAEQVRPVVRETLASVREAMHLS